MFPIPRSIHDRFEVFEARIALAASADVEVPDPAALIDESNSSLSDAEFETHDASVLRERYGLSGAGQTVAVIDSGIAYDHMALGGGFGPSHRVVGGRDFTEENDTDPYDDAPAGFHGTHVAGIIASSDATALGLAPDVDLVALRVFNDQGKGDFDWIHDALVWVHEHQFDYEFPITTVNLSIGSDWELPDQDVWSAIEAALLRLHQDGIFVSVAAGNEFAEHQARGLSYPAASEHVVPVASVSAAGQLSHFSQRDARVLAAPGENIRSTAVDYLYDFNGITDDFLVASGTSMAAPYVAGASVLVREAFQRIGRSDVDQEDILDVLFDSADIVRDKLTSQDYRRINLERAVDNLLRGTDDYGNGPDEAYDLGPLDTTVQVNGHFDYAGDADSFRFRTSESGTVEVRLASPVPDVTWQTNVDDFEVDGSTLILDVDANQDVRFVVTAANIANYQLSLSDRVEPIDAGTVDFRPLEIALDADDDVIQFSTGTGGLFSAQLTSSQAAGLTVYDKSGYPLSTATNEPLHVALESNATYYVRVNNHSSTDRIQLRQSVSESNDRILVYGTDGPDDVRLTLDHVNVNGAYWQLPDHKSIRIFGMGGSDTIDVALTKANQTAYVDGRSLMISGLGRELTVRNFERVDVHGEGGSDLVSFAGTDGDDIIYSHENLLLVKSPQSSQIYEFTGFASGRLQGGSAGNDTIHLYDSPQDDRLAVFPQRGTFTRGTQSTAFDGFEQVWAYSTSGGRDSAFFYDSAGHDRHYAKPDRAWMRSATFYNYAYGFDRTEAYATHGGIDKAFLYDSPDHDQLYAKSDRAWIQNPSLYNYVYGFDRVDAYATQGGTDTAYFYDSAQDDDFHGTPDRSWIEGRGYFNYGFGFERVEAYATHGGNDRAQFVDSRHSDTLRVRADRQWITGPGYFNYAFGFNQILATSNTTNVASDTQVDRVILFDSLPATAVDDAVAALESSEPDALRIWGYDTLQWARYSAHLIRAAAIDIHLSGRV